MATLIFRRPVETFTTARRGIAYTVVCVNQRISLQIDEVNLLDRHGDFDPTRLQEVKESFLKLQCDHYDQHTSLSLREPPQIVSLSSRRWYCLDLEVIPYGLGT
ncbi:MAG: hypothetical protein RLZZ347_328 [Candidatus Parcubacteria bacterium]|jgi:hypothetical protein